MTRRDRFRLSAALFGLALVLITASLGALLLVAHGRADVELARAYHQKARLLQAEVKSTVEYAAELGIPLQAASVVRSGFAYLERLLDENPEVRLIAVTTLDGIPIFHAGADRPAVAALVADVGLSLSHDDDPVAVGSASVLVMPLALPGQPPFGRLYVATDAAIADIFLVPALGDMILVLLAMALVAGQGAGWVTGSLCASRLRRLERVFGQGAAGTFALAATPERGPDSGDEIGQVLRLHNLLVLRLRDRVQRLLAHAAEVQGAVFDDAVRRQVAALHGTLRATLEPTVPAASPVPFGPPNFGPLRLPVLALAMAEAMATTAVAAQGQPAAGLLPILGVLAVGALAAVAAPAGGNARRIVLLGLMVGAFGHGLGAAAATALPAARLAGGLGAAAALAGAVRYATIAGEPERAAIRRRKLLGPLLAGLGAGAGLGLAFGRTLAPSSLFALATAVTLLGLAAAAGLLVPPPPPSPPPPPPPPQKG